MKPRFIKLTECYSQKENVVYFNVEMIQAICVEGKHTILKHPSHNNGGFHIKETPEQILEIIKQLN